MVKLSLPQVSLLSQRVTFSACVFIFITIFHSMSSSIASTYSSPSNRYNRQLAYGGDGGGGGGYGIQPYHRRQQSAEINFFQTMMSLNFDMTEVVAMYRNVTAVAETSGCGGHCRTPMALWVVQSFYPCYSLKKADCPKGLVCCMADPSNSNRLVASANTLQDTRVKARPSLVESLSGAKHNGGIHKGNNNGPSVLPSSGEELAVPQPTPHQPTQSTTLFDEEYFKNNFIQDEIPE